PLCMNDGVEKLERLAEHLFVEVEQRCESLVLSGRAHLILSGEAGQKRDHVLRPEVAGVLATARCNETPCPAYASFRRARTAVPAHKALLNGFKDRLRSLQLAPVRMAHIPWAASPVPTSSLPFSAR